MSEDKKRLTGAELLEQQKQHEAAARLTEQAKRDDDAKRRASAALDAAKAAIERVEASWYDAVTDAATRDGVRFVAVAQVIEEGTGYGDLVSALMNAIQAASFTPQIVGSGSILIVDERGQPLQGAVRRDDAAAARNVVLMPGKLRGWMPAELPKIGSSGSLQYLIVKWG